MPVEKVIVKKRLPFAARPIEQEEVKVEELSSSSEEVEYIKETVEGVCDFDFCQE